MKLSLKVSAVTAIETDLLALPVYEEEARPEARAKRLPARLRSLDARAGGSIARALASGDFAARSGDLLLLYPESPAGARRLLLVGAGKRAAMNAEQLRRVAATAVNQAAARKAASVAVLAPGVRGLGSPQIATALAEGALLAAYHFDAYQEKKQEGRRALRRVVLVFEKLSPSLETRRALARAEQIARCQNLARDLSNEPPNELPPARLAAVARRVARETGLRVRVLRGADLQRRGMNALLAVGGGSVHPPHLIVIEHRGHGTARSRAQSPVCLVGKGITFDSGGISIKPAANMQEMKHDMSGAATVLAVLRAAALLDLPQRVVGVIAAAENMPSGSAYRPGDIVRSMSGKTIEIVNTDAEGRVVLADALHYAATEFAPQVMVDVATLTGAAMVALGPWATAALGNDEALVESIREAGDSTGERIWPMPLLEEHRQVMRSEVADLKNSGGRDGGVSTAAAFLSAFTGKTPWVHLDIAGTGWTSIAHPYHRGGGTGVGVRLLVRWLESRTISRKAGTRRRKGI